MPIVCSSEDYTDSAGLSGKVWLLIFPTLTFPFLCLFHDHKTYPNIVIVVNLATSSIKQEGRQETVIKMCQK